MQTYTSAKTSVNSTKAPAIYSDKNAVRILTGQKVIDIGGGKFDTGIKAGKKYGATVSVYDPYNRDIDHNLTVLSQDYDVAIISNVLNVINTAEGRTDVLRLAATKASTILITVYSGDGSSVGKVTKSDCWQENRRIETYIPEVVKALPSYTVTRSGKLIIASKEGR